MYELTDNELLCVNGGMSSYTTEKIRLYSQKMASIGIYTSLLVGLVYTPLFTNCFVRGAVIDAVLDGMLGGGFLGLGIGFFVAQDEYGPLPEGTGWELLNFDW